MRSILAAALVYLMIPTATAPARTWIVNTAGTGDAPTIQAGIDSASAGDTVKVSSGTYYEHDIQMKSGVDLRHVNSLTENCIIDANGEGRVMIFDGVDATSNVSYMTFREGHAVGSGSAGCGGGLFFTNYSSPQLWLCDFENNVADEMGGAVYCEDHSAPVFNWGVLRWNQAGMGGGGLACASSAAPVFNFLSLTGDITGGNGGGAHCSDNATPHFERCNILNCVAAGFAGGIYTETGSIPLVERSVIVFNMDGEGVYAADDLSVPTLKCCAIYGNEGGDFVGRIADQDSANGNFALDPLFCDTTVVLPDEAMDVEECSPCLYGSHPYGYFCGAEIGYTYTGCGCGEATEPSTWGMIKSLYR